MNRKFLLLAAVLVICVVSVYLRVYGIREGLFPFTFDQGRDILDVQKIASGDFTLIGPHTAIGGLFTGPLYYYLLSIPFLVSAGDPRAVVLFMGLMGIVGTLAGYFMVKHIAGLRAGLWFVALSAISSPLVSFSRYFHNPNPLGFFFIGILYFLFRAVVFGKPINYIPLLFLTGLTYHFELAFAAAITVCIGVTLAIFTSGKFLKDRMFYIGLLVFLLTFLPQVVFELRNDFLMTKSVVAAIQGENDDLYSTPKTLLQSFEEKEYIPWDDFTTAVAIDRRLFAVFWLVVLCFGYMYGTKQQQTMFRVLVTIIGVFLAGSILYPGPIYGWYRAGFPQLHIFAVAMAVSILWSRSSSKTKTILMAVAVSMYVLQIAHLHEGWKAYNINKQLGSFRNEMRVVQYIFEDARADPNAGEFGVMVYTPPVYDYAWRYLFEWYGNKQYQYSPQRSIRPLTYLVIEPDPEQPWRANGWLETVVAGGRNVSVKEFDDGIVVEKRVYNETEYMQDM